MLSIKCVLFRIFGQRAAFVKHAAAKINHQYSFIHCSGLRLGETTIEIKMPSLSPTMTEGTIVKWLKKEGDVIIPGDVLCEIQTDKAVVGLEIEEEGILSKILVPEDTKYVQLGEVIALLVGEGDIVTENVQMPDKSSFVSETDIKLPKSAKKDSQVCGPSVKKLLTEYGIKYSDIPSSGPKGNVLKGDVLKFIQSTNLKQISFPVETKASKVSRAQDIKLTEGLSHIDIPVSSARRSVANQLIHCKTAMPHAYMNVDCKIDKIKGFIKKMKEDGFEVSMNDFLIKSAATALRKVPEMNVINLNGQIQSLNTINISITFAGESGYLSATVKGADNLTVQLISEQMKSVSAKVDGWTLEKEEFTGGSFRISNLGLIGVSEFSAVIYPPEVAVLAVGTIRHIFHDEKPLPTIKAILSFNNELINENEAGLFLSHLKQCLENPLSICLS